MRSYASGLLCAALSTVFSFTPVQAQLLLHVPVGQGGSPTAQGTADAIAQIKNIPGGADIVPAEEFQKGYALSMKDMLFTTPGVIAQPRWGEESRLSIRGSGLSRSFHLRGLTLLQDGVPFNLADGSADFQEIDPLVLKHVEVYRGGNGLRYGSATLGGAINFVTPTARTVDYNGLFRAEAGSEKTARLHAQAAKIFDGGDIFAATTATTGDGLRQQSDQDNRRFFGNAGIQLGDDAETRFYIGWNDIHQEVPGTLSRQVALTNPTSVPGINATNDYARDIHSLRLANKTAVIFDNGFKLEGGIYANKRDLYHPIFQVVDQDSLDLGAYGRLEGEYSLGDYAQEFVLGLNTKHGTNDAKRFVNVFGERGNLTADGKQVSDNIELYGENRFLFADGWKFITGLQANVAARDYKDRLNATNDDNKTYHSLNPKLGLLWELDVQSEIYAGVTRSSEAPTFSELMQGAVPGFVPLEMQKAWTAEIGTRGERNGLTWDVTLYHARIKDELLNYTVTADVPASTFNAGTTIHQGIEAGLGWRANDLLSFQAIYNLNDFRFEDDAQFGDNDLAGAPPHEFHLSARLEKNGFYIEPNVEWVPEAAWVDYANTLKADSYVLTGIKAGWEINENASVFFDARNLTNERTIATFGTVTDARTAATNVFYPNDGRSVYAGVKIKF
jgi:iron complex outermembrane receptor protein